jgi:hypothetical protein
MVFQELVHPGVVLDFARFADAFNYHHLPMARSSASLALLWGR